MASTIVEPIGPLTELDKEILDFWKLKNRYDHIHSFISQFNEYCQELIGGQNASDFTPSKREPEIAIDTIAPQEQSITLDASSEFLNQSEAIVISPGNDLLQIDNIESPGPEITACQSPLEEADTESLILATPLSEPVEKEESEQNDNGKIVLPPSPPTTNNEGESPVLDLDREVEESFWKIIRKQKQFYCRLISQQGETMIVQEERGPFQDLLQARAAIGMTD